MSCDLHFAIQSDWFDVRNTLGKIHFADVHVRLEGRVVSTFEATVFLKALRQHAGSMSHHRGLVEHLEYKARTPKEKDTLQQSIQSKFDFYCRVDLAMH